MSQKMCRELDVTADKLRHFGRTYGALYAEIQDMPIAKIEHLSNW
jgi:hypothetical protein